MSVNTNVRFECLTESQPRMGPPGENGPNDGDDDEAAE